jgi:hypothetical protein
MLRGSLEFVSPAIVSGWIYSPVAEVRNHLVLAFVDQTCVGQGRVEFFRQDLASAGLGDGFLGFHFPVTLEHPRDALRIVVRLDGSDFSLIYKDSMVAPRQGARMFT